MLQGVWQPLTHVLRGVRRPWQTYYEVYSRPERRTTRCTRPRQTYYEVYGGDLILILLSRTSQRRHQELKTVAKIKSQKKVKSKQQIKEYKRDVRAVLTWRVGLWSDWLWRCIRSVLPYALCLRKAHRVPSACNHKHELLNNTRSRRTQSATKYT